MGNANDKRKRDGSEVSTFTSPTGLYASCNWDQKALKKTNSREKNRTHFPWTGGKELSRFRRVPNLFFVLPRWSEQGNLLQARNLHRVLYSSENNCSSTNSMSVLYPPKLQCDFTGPLSREEREKEEVEEQKVRELQIKAREEELARDQEREKSRERSTSLPTVKTFEEVAREISSGRVTYNSHISSSLPPPPIIFSNPQDQRNKNKGNMAGRSSLTQVNSRGRSRTEYELGSAWENDPNMEDLMLMEAIRRSLLDVGGTPDSTGVLNTTSDQSSSSQVETKPNTQSNHSSENGDLFFYFEEDGNRVPLFSDENKDDKDNQVLSSREKPGKKEEDLGFSAAPTTTTTTTSTSSFFSPTSFSSSSLQTQTTSTFTTSNNFPFTTPEYQSSSSSSPSASPSASPPNRENTLSNHLKNATDRVHSGELTINGSVLPPRGSVAANSGPPELSL
eukprot:TRINITY_DN3355_c0_g1_i2.p1 TRINITY_DN3355_c0_g1~~TRINITY_DN3355_c0_g1_i2.p1  ORF type:complete len:467 (+),score=108.21 TRINITY_DN3355_c0_g1_i2:57-1403(+)